MQTLFVVFGGSQKVAQPLFKNRKTASGNATAATPQAIGCHVGDKETGEVIRGVQWHVYEKNPFKGPQPKLEAYRWPEGECKRFASEMLEQVYGPRRIKMMRPYMRKSIIAPYSVY